MTHIKIPRTEITKTEKAMAQQPEILAQDWARAVSPKIRAALKNAKAVTFVGTGTSHHCALWADWLCKLGTSGVSSRAMSSWDFLTARHDAILGKDEAVVVISHRGYRGLTRKLIDQLKKEGLLKRVVLVAGEGAPHGPAALVEASPQEGSGAHTMSLIGAIGAASELVALIAGPKQGDVIRKNRATTAELLAAIRTEAEDLSAALAGISPRGSRLHFVGGGPMHAVALELALKAREMAHLPALAFNTEEFLHGPLASIEEEDTVVLIKPFAGKKMGALEKLMYLDRAESCRKAAEAVGALVIEPAWGKPIAGPSGLLALSWQALLPLYWGQILCLSTAKAWGINPDLTRQDDPRYEEAKKHSELG